MGEPKPRSGVTLGYTGIYWGSAGIYWDAVLRAGVPASPRELGKSNGEFLAALKQALQLAHVHTGTSHGVGSDARPPSGMATRAFPVPRPPRCSGGIQLNPKSSARKGKEKALCSHG